MGTLCTLKAGDNRIRHTILCTLSKNTITTKQQSRSMERLIIEPQTKQYTCDVLEHIEHIISGITIQAMYKCCSSMLFKKKIHAHETIVKRIAYNEGNVHIVVHVLLLDINEERKH